MKLIQLFVSFLIFMNTLNNNSSKEIGVKNIIQFALYDMLQDVYPKGLFQYFKDHNIKTVSFVAKDYEKNKVDSLAYLEINNDGKLITRTTKECTTIGCLPYMNRQEYFYSNNKINRIDVYVFRNNKQSALSEWLKPDTSEFYKFDWNTYSYEGDTIFVDTGIALYKYLTDHNDNIIFRVMHIKNSNQIVYTNISYTDSTIIFKDKFNFGDTTLIEYCKMKNNHIELWSLNNKDSELVKEWIFNSTGLVNEIYNYRNGKIISKTKLSYTFYN